MEIIFDGDPCSGNSKECNEEFIKFLCKNTEYMDEIIDNSKDNYDTERTGIKVGGIILCIILFIVWIISCWFSKLYRLCSECDCDFDL